MCIASSFSSPALSSPFSFLVISSPSIILPLPLFSFSLLISCLPSCVSPLPSTVFTFFLPLQDAKRSRHHHVNVSWLRRTEYISTEPTRFQPQTNEKIEATVGFAQRRKKVTVCISLILLFIHSLLCSYFGPCLSFIGGVMCVCMVFFFFFFFFLSFLSFFLSFFLDLQFLKYLTLFVE